MASMSLVSLPSARISSRSPSASITFLTGSRRSTASVSLANSNTRTGLLHCSFVPSSTPFSFPSSFAGKLFISLLVRYNLL
uniref:Uncharacterized protein n=1 Tax=Nelumbo nucifera TaxID=4432 RepID=A0A822XPQ2_NELNU|nr:TPA_asm: hypothetical protein HUJ06_022634 [Nelumbo nucifera]